MQTHKMRMPNTPRADGHSGPSAAAVPSISSFGDGAPSTHVEYWRSKLGDVPVLQVPTDRPRLPVPRRRGLIHFFRLPEKLTREVKNLGADHDATLFMTLLAIFNVMLFRYTGQTDFAVGSPGLQGCEGVPGSARNTLVLRTDFTGDMRFVDLLGQVRDTVREAHSHAPLPCLDLLNLVMPPGALGHPPLFQVVFAFFEGIEPGENVPGTGPETIQAEGDTAVDLTLCCWEEGKSLRGKIEFDADLFEPATIDRMAGHFQILMEGISADPSRRIDELPILPGWERELVLQTWNATARDYPLDECIHTSFERRAAKRPDAVAVVSEGKHLTYRELDLRANHLAGHLRRSGVGPDTIVGVYVERSAEMIIAILGILKAGGAYLPLDTNYPMDRLTYMLEDAQAPVLLTRESIANRLPALKASIVFVDAPKDPAQPQGPEAPPGYVGPENLAYVIYTSGSTGKPKGTPIRHRGVSNLIRFLVDFYEVDPESRVLQFAAFGFDASVSEIFPALVAGATLVMAPQEKLMSSEGLQQVLQQEAISVVTLPPSLLAVFEPGDLPALKTVISAGEPCFWDIAERWGKGCRFINGYGPTETTVAASYYVVDKDHPKPTKTVPIGRPIANTRIYLLDANLQPVPIGVAAELYVSGVGLARGYLNRPELTAERFIPNPFSPDPGSRLYKSGDLARYLPDGNIEFLGRVDHQVKLRGFRIELGEIEARMREIPFISNCAVVLREDRPEAKRLVAYYVTKPGVEPSSADCRSHLQSELPDYMVPQLFIRLQSLPLTPNGKVDRKALPHPDDDETAATNYVTPRTHWERQIAAIWQEVLKLEKIGVHSDFFELGGNSLLAARVLSRLNRMLDTQLPIRMLFEARTVATLAETIAAALSVAEAQHAVQGLQLETTDREVVEI